MEFHENQQHSGIRLNYFFFSLFRSITHIKQEKKNNLRHSDVFTFLSDLEVQSNKMRIKMRPYLVHLT